MNSSKQARLIPARDSLAYALKQRGSGRPYFHFWPVGYAGPDCSGAIGCFSVGHFLEFKKAVMVISGTHGAEFEAGHEIQRQLALNYQNFVPEGTGLILVHGLNPWGCENGRRCDMDNVDFNRACLDDRSCITGSFYEFARPMVEPEFVDNNYVLQLLDVVKDKQTLGKLIKAVVAGQYYSPKGLFYGGCAMPDVLVQLKHLFHGVFSGLDHLAVIDIHTGLPNTSIISPLENIDCAGAVRTRKMFGDNIVFPSAGATSLGYSVKGDVLRSIASWLPNTETTGVALEMGTIPLEESFPLVILENWLYHNQDKANLRAVQEALKTAGFSQEAFRKSFIPDDPEWWKGLRDTSFTLFNSAVAGLQQ